MRRTTGGSSSQGSSTGTGFVVPPPQRQRQQQQQARGGNGNGSGSGSGTQSSSGRSYNLLLDSPSKKRPLFGRGSMRTPAAPSSRDPSFRPSATPSPVSHASSAPSSPDGTRVGGPAPSAPSLTPSLTHSLPHSLTHSHPHSLTYLLNSSPTTTTTAPARPTAAALALQGLRGSVEIIDTELAAVAAEEAEVAKELAANDASARQARASAAQRGAEVGLRRKDAARLQKGKDQVAARGVEEAALATQVVHASEAVEVELEARAAGRAELVAQLGVVRRLLREEVMEAEVEACEEEADRVKRQAEERAKAAAGFEAEEKQVRFSFSLSLCTLQSL